MKLVVILLLCASIYTLDDTLEDFRKHFGLSFYHKCKEYIKIFKCLTACKSIGFQVFRMDWSCKCTCHVMKTTTVVPFFMWRTNGTTRKVPKTFSPQLYHVVGTLSPATYSGEITEDFTEVANVTEDRCAHFNVTEAGNATVDAGNSTTGGVVAGNETTEAVSETAAEEQETTAPPEARQ